MAYSRTRLCAGEGGLSCLTMGSLFPIIFVKPPFLGEIKLSKNFFGKKQAKFFVYT
jgi:hypothetical protein